MPFSKIAILGASGSLGPHILAALLETFPVSAITILSTLRPAPRDALRMTRGQSGLLFLFC